MSGRSEKRSELTICATLIDNWEARRKFPYFTKIVYVKLFKTRAHKKFVARPISGETESMTLLTKCRWLYYCTTTYNKYEERTEC